VPSKPRVPSWLNKAAIFKPKTASPMAAPKGARKPTKYGNVPTMGAAPWGGQLLYASKAEARVADALAMLKAKQGIKGWAHQVSFPIGTGPRGTTRHILDFVVVNNDNSVTFYEVKGRDLPTGKRKRKDLEALLGTVVQVNGPIRS
jgi:hypothetical protein